MRHLIPSTLLVLWLGVVAFCGPTVAPAYDNEEEHTIIIASSNH